MPTFQPSRGASHGPLPGDPLCVGLVSAWQDAKGLRGARCAGYSVRKENLLWLPINRYRQKMSINLFELEREKPTCA
jgi:hypothetical protein